MTQNIGTATQADPILDLVSRVTKLLQRQAFHPRQRMLVALAGVPGSGKSTVSNALLEELGRRGISDVTIAPMVGSSVPNGQSIVC